MACQTTSSKSAWRSTTTPRHRRLFRRGPFARAPIQPGNQYDVWRKRRRTGLATAKKPGPRSPAFCSASRPIIEGDTVGQNWNWNAGISNASTDVLPTLHCNFDNRDDRLGFYCPTRRSSSIAPAAAATFDRRTTDDAFARLDRRGTDYGGWRADAAFTLKTGYNLCDATMHYDPDFLPTPA